MPLVEAEIKPGIIAVIDPAILCKNPQVTQPPTADGEFRKGPFVCLIVGDGNSAWTPITTKTLPKYRRLEILAEWRMEGGHTWRAKAQYLQDGRKIYVGPNAAFIASTVAEWPYKSGRPWITDDGMKEIWRVIEQFPKTNPAPSFA